MGAYNFLMLNASAGSGKTYALVRHFLFKLLSSPKIDGAKEMLAVTFTNRAVQEMKNRILDYLEAFSKTRFSDTKSSMFKELSEAIGCSDHELQLRAKKTLNYILHHYAHFSVMTIDRFTHQLVRTFSRDLGLSSSFELLIDNDYFIQEAIEQLISKVGQDPPLTKVLLSFVNEKTDSDRSWDVSYDLIKMAALFYNENNYIPLQSLKDKNTSQFNDLQQTLEQQYKFITQQLILKAENIKLQIEKRFINTSDFSYRTIPHFVDDIIKQKWPNEIKKRLYDQYQSGVYYKTTTPVNAQNQINQIADSIGELIEQAQKTLPQILLYKEILKNIIPLSTLNAIRSQVEELQYDRNVQILSSFNALIAQTLQQQSATFLFERLGVRYKHYFMDEFQDTSLLQWTNFGPLLDHNLSTAYGSLLLVGDAKQSIYRWRGANVEQFMNLASGNSPFSVNPKVQVLPKNYRSLDNIVQFNNLFFRQASISLEKEEHRDLFDRQSHQQTNDKPGGYISLTWIESERAKEEDSIYGEEVLKRIQSCIENGRMYSEICVLTRNRKQGVAIAKKLSTHQIPVISSETLLLGQNKKVLLLIALLHLKGDELHSRSRIDLFDYFNFEKDHFNETANAMETPLEPFLKQLTHGSFSFKRFKKLPLYSSLEYAIQSLLMLHNCDAFIESFMNEVYSFLGSRSASERQFLEYWNQQKPKMSVRLSSAIDAVQIMTIHKAKGLEFPVVIFPYADTKLFDVKPSLRWFPLEKENFSGFDYVLTTNASRLRNMGEKARYVFDQSYNQHQLDALNLLYVALTRPKEELHIISNYKKINTASYSSLFNAAQQNISELKIHETGFEWGRPLVRQSEKVPFKSQRASKWISTLAFDAIQIKTKRQWEHNHKEALEEGTIFHEMMAQVMVESDIEDVLNTYFCRGQINATQKNRYHFWMKELVSHPELKHFFDPSHQHYCERVIYTEQGTVIRPDRLVVIGGCEAQIIEYKTGQPNSSHKKQILKYAEEISKQQLIVTKKHVIYLTDSVDLMKIH